MRPKTGGPCMRERQLLDQAREATLVFVIARTRVIRKGAGRRGGVHRELGCMWQHDPGLRCLARGCTYVFSCSWKARTVAWISMRIGINVSAHKTRSVVECTPHMRIGPPHSRRSCGTKSVFPDQPSLQMQEATSDPAPAAPIAPPAPCNATVVLHVPPSPHSPKIDVATSW